MYSVGLWLVLFGYALFYTGLKNVQNDGQGPTFAQSLGFPVKLPGGAGQGTGQTGSREGPSSLPQPKAV